VAADEPATPTSYAAGNAIDVSVEHVAVGACLLKMPRFLRSNREINIPLKPTYRAAFVGTAAFWRGVLEDGPAIA
jgi:hypothetical protein